MYSEKKYNPPGNQQIPSWEKENHHLQNCLWRRDLLVPNRVTTSTSSKSTDTRCDQVAVLPPIFVLLPPGISIACERCFLAQQNRSKKENGKVCKREMALTKSGQTVDTWWCLFFVPVKCIPSGAVGWDLVDGYSISFHTPLGWETEKNNLWKKAEFSNHFW